MSSTPLFDAIARRIERSGTARPTPAPAARLDAPTGLVVPRAVVPVVGAPETRTPSSPLDVVGPVATSTDTDPAATTPAVPAGPPTVVPTDLVEMIDGIPASLRASLAQEHVVGREQLSLVEAVADAVTRAVVDAVAIEVERIVASGVVRA